MNTRIIKHARKLQRQKLFPAAVIGASSSYFNCVARSKKDTSIVFFTKLRTKLQSLGSLYLKVNGNYLGCCAEVHAANTILYKSRYRNLNEIKFSHAIRPRTMQRIKTCKNCKIIFS